MTDDDTIAPLPFQTLKPVPQVPSIAFEEGLYGGQDQRQALFSALAKAQGEFEVAGFDRANTHFKTRYATVASIISATKAALAKHGLALIQPTTRAKELVTILTHVDGAFLVAKVELGAFTTIQDYGSRLTYLRRYCRAALLGVATADDDDDGNDAAGEDQPPPPRTQARPPAPRTQGGPGKPPPGKPPAREPKPEPEAGLPPSGTPEPPPAKLEQAPAEPWDPGPALPDESPVRVDGVALPIVSVMRAHIDAGIAQEVIPCGPNEPADSAGPAWVKALLKRNDLKLNVGEARTVIRTLRDKGVNP